MNNANAPESPLIVYGGLVAEVNPTDLPLGSSPICCDMDFTIGSVKTRDGLRGVYTIGESDVMCGAQQGTSTPDMGSSGEVVWTNPDGLVDNTCATVEVNGSGGGGGGGDLPSVVQSAQASGTGTDAAVTLPGVSAANWIVILAGFFPTVPQSVTLSASDNVGDTLSNLFGSANFHQHYSGYAVQGAIGGSTTVTFHYNTSGTWVIQAVEVKGVGGVSSFIASDFVASGTITASAFMPSGPVLLLKWGGDFNNSLATSDSPFTPLQTNSQLKSGWTFESATGSHTYSTTWTGSPDPLLQLVAAIIGLLKGSVPPSGPTSEQLSATQFPCLTSIPETSSIIGMEVDITGFQSNLDPSSIVTLTLLDQFNPIATRTFQLPLVEGTVMLGGMTDTWGQPWPNAQVISSAFGFSFQVTSSIDTTFHICGVSVTLWFTPVSACDFDWIGSMEQQDGDRLTLALDACGVFWQEDVNNDPGVLIPFYSNILPNTFAVGVTEDDREFIALSDQIEGTDMPRQYDGVNVDRISQVGPGAPPQVTFASTEYPIVSITQDINFSFTQLRSVLWSSGPTATHTAGNVLTFYFNIGTDISKILIGSSVILSAFTGSLAPINSSNFTVGDPGNPYIVTSVGTAIGAGGLTYPIFTVIAPSTSNFDTNPGAGNIHLTLSTLTTSIPVPNLQVGSQMTVAGVTPAPWDGTWTVLFTLNGAQLSITGTSLTGGVATYDWTLITGTAPAVGEQVTVTGTANGNGIFNVSNATITAIGPGTFSVAIVSPDITSAAESGNAIINGTIFQFDPGIVITDGTGGFLVVAGGLGSGTRGAVVMFLTRNGYLTAPSPPVIFTLNQAANSIIVSQLPIGPPDTIARVVAFTGANGATQSGGGGFYFWIPTPVSVIDNGQLVTYTSTIINDNTTTTATFTFTDAVLLAASSISIQGSNNFAQVEVGSCLGVISYAARNFYWGVQNKVQNLLNFSFDGGIGQFIPPPGDTGIDVNTYPLGWTVDPVNGNGGTVATSPIFGDAYYIQNTSGMTQTVYGMIEQPAFQDYNKVPIIAAHMTYSVRVTADCPSQIGNGQLVIDLFSPSLNRQFGNFTIPLSSMLTAMRIFTGTLLTTPFAGTPNDLLLRIYATNLPNNGDVRLDRIEVFPTEEPVLTTDVFGSYFNNFEAVDGITGDLGFGTQNQEPVRCMFSLFDNLYAVKTHSMYATSDNGITEPDGWTVREVSNKVGTPSIHGVAAGEGWALIAGLAGLYIFDGGQPVKMSPEIDPLWQTINWDFGHTLWLKNDTNAKKIYIGIPIPTPNQWMPEFPVNSNPTVPNVVLMCQYKELNTSTALSFEGSIRQSYMGDLRTYQLGRKWSAWSIEAHFAEFITRPDTTTPIFFCADDGSHQIYQQVVGVHNDPGSMEPLGLYYTYPFIKAQEAQAIQVGLHNLRAEYASMLTVGGGQIDVTIAPDTLTSPYLNALAPLPLGNPPPWGDTEFPLNDLGTRFFVGFKPHTVGDWWELSRFVLNVMKDQWSPVRGGNF
jgi:hypothetical protein